MAVPLLALLAPVLLASPHDLDASSFEVCVATGNCLVMLHAPQCSSCAAAAEAFDRAAHILHDHGGVDVGRLDVRKHRFLARRVMASVANDKYPSIVFFHRFDGASAVEVHRFDGEPTGEDLSNFAMGGFVHTKAMPLIPVSRFAPEFVVREAGETLARAFGLLWDELHAKFPHAVDAVKFHATGAARELWGSCLRARFGSEQNCRWVARVFGYILGCGFCVVMTGFLLSAIGRLWNRLLGRPPPPPAARKRKVPFGTKRAPARAKVD